MSDQWVATTNRFAEAIRAEIKRQSNVSHLWTNDHNDDDLTEFNVDGPMDLMALAEVMIKLALDEGFAA